MAEHIIQPLLHVTIPYCICIAVARLGLLDGVFTELGLEYYAEKTVSWLPQFLTMPFNSSINLGYIILGVYWLSRENTTAAGKEKPELLYLKNVFAWMALAYGPVQWIRIVTQTHRYAVLDQWFTLPIFAWVVVWCQYICKGWSTMYTVKTEAVSILSYLFTLFHSQGFEVALGFHILLVITKGIYVQHRYGDTSSMNYFILAVLSCIGFVVLKLLDHWLAQSVIFQRMTGHFWSKVCDLLQFHYTFRFLMYLSNAKRVKK
ncbi:transmembrane protein 187 [Protopterus annectens]|uniref:transmembrane protein 187 n=1 Tax=Protopterus annectens TaxID=7888 RepID=UPI001CFC3353|nr:transmembrane protein 187 [Protopterus annectens]